MKRLLSLQDARIGIWPDDGWGIAYFDVSSLHFVLYPIGVNFIVGLWKDLIFFISYGSQYRDKLLWKSRDQGFEEGYQLAKKHFK